MVVANLHTVEVYCFLDVVKQNFYQPLKDGKDSYELYSNLCTGVGAVNILTLVAVL